MRKISLRGATASGVLIVAVLGGVTGGAIALSAQGGEPAQTPATTLVETIATETAEAPAAPAPAESEPVEAAAEPVAEQAPAPTRTVERAEVSEPTATVDAVARDETPTPPKTGATVVTPSAAPATDPEPNPDLPSTTELEPVQLENGQTAMTRKGQKLPANAPAPAAG